MFDESIRYYSEQFGVPDSWIRAVIQTESNWNPNARNPSDPQGGAWGLMQLLYGTARGLGFQGEAAELLDPDVNIQYGSKLLAELMQRYGDDFRSVYSAYNSGSPTKWQSSNQVFQNVERALSNLAQWTEATVETAIENPVLSLSTVISGLSFLYLILKRKR